MKRIVEKVISGTIGQRAPGSYVLYVLARRIISAFENGSVNIEMNGERWLQARIATTGPNWAVDVGANKGDWASGMLAASRGVRVVCYEPVPDTFRALQDNICSDRAILVEGALSDKLGNLTIQSVRNRPDLSSAHADYFGFEDVETLSIAAHTGDAELLRLGIDRLDILKVDAEGHDFAVLEGFRENLARSTIRFIQFEYNFATLTAGHSLKDFFELLTPGFLLCRLLRSGLEACGYHPSMDNFGQSNWVAVRRDLLDEDVIATFNIRLARGLPGDRLLGTLTPDHPLRTGR